MHVAARNGNLDIVTLCLQKGISPNTVNLNGDTPLHYAVCSGQIELVVALLAKGANPNIQVNISFLSASLETYHSNPCERPSLSFWHTFLVDVYSPGPRLLLRFIATLSCCCSIAFTNECKHKLLSNLVACPNLDR